MRDSECAEERPLVGDVIAGKYRIEGIAGEGGMGIVYEAEHVILRQRVAVKVLLPGTRASADTLERFSLEASAVARIACEHVVRVMDAGALPNGTPYLVMEYLDGCDLEELFARLGPLPPATAVDFALQALEALAHAHAARVIHRDLKPANLFLARSRDGRQILKLLDFGISKSFDVTSNEDGIAGSPTYMSPEQLKNDPLDPRTDLWSLGVVFYELVSGSPPFAGGFSELVAAILDAGAVPLSEKVPGIDPSLSHAIAKCLRRSRDARWTTTAELARALVPHGTGAWVGALERIERALSQAAPMPISRRFESFENALTALVAEGHRENLVETMAPPERSPQYRRPASAGHEAFGDTIPAPPSEARIVFGAPPERPTPSPPSSSNALRLLLIDGSRITLDRNQEALTASGFDVRSTMSVDEFDALLESWKPHLVLMNAVLPEITGDELCGRVKARFRAKVPVVFVSDLPRAALAERAKASKADAFLSTSGEVALVDFVRNICAMTYSPEDLP